MEITTPGDLHIFYSSIATQDRLEMKNGLRGRV